MAATELYAVWDMVGPGEIRKVFTHKAIADKFAEDCNAAFKRSIDSGKAFIRTYFERFEVQPLEVSQGFTNLDVDKMV